MQRYCSIWLLLCFLQGNAQTAVYRKMHFIGKDSAELYREFPTREINGDSLQQFVELRNDLIHLNEMGYLTAVILFRQTLEDTLRVYVHEGEKIHWIQIKPGNVPDYILKAAGYRESAFKGKVFRADQYNRLSNRILQELENKGYPFASIQTDSLEIDSSGITAVLNLRQVSFIVFDTIYLRGSAKVQPWFIAKVMGVKTGSPYSERTIQDASSRLNQLPFLTVGQSPSVYFYANRAMPVIWLDKRRANLVDGILGFAPNSQIGQDKLLVTGEANIHLQNLFETGKSFELNYRSFLGNSQDLRVKLVWPYIFRTQVALDYNLTLLKQDTSFLDVRNEIGMQYRFKGTDQVRFFYQVQTTTLITVDTITIKNTRTLPAANDLSNIQYGISMKIVRYDYFRNPRKGYGLEWSGSVGSKQLIRNATIDALRFTDDQGNSVSLYDGLERDWVQYRFTGQADCFIPLTSSTVFRIQGMAGKLYAPRLFTSELFRIGGIRTLKGFDEQVIFASAYMLLNTEWRYLLQRNSFFTLFFNGAIYENIVPVQPVSDKPIGFGAGLNFETEAGIFSLYYALGKAFNNPWEVSKAKVHFGYVSYF
ncbi:MAG: hypothetical protein WCU83_09645 [Bacteroidia bacterium]